MKCRSCGKKIKSDFALCPYCGAAIPVPEEEPEQEQIVEIPETKEDEYSSSTSFVQDVYDDDEIEFNDDYEQDEEEEEEEEEDEYYEIPLKKIVIIAVIVIVLAGIGYGAFRFLSKPLSATTETIEAGSGIDPLTLVELKESRADDYTLSIESSDLDQNVPGTYTVVYLLTDNNGKTSTQSFDFNVVDTTAPVITATDTIYVPLDSEFDIASYLTVVDNVDGIMGIGQIQVDGIVDTSTAGTYSLAVTATDAAGNTRETTISAIVEDMGDTDAFFEKLIGNWYHEESGIVIKFSNDSGYKIDIGMYQSEGFGTGSVRFNSVNAALTESVMEWDYTSYYSDEDSGDIVYEDIQTVNVTVDTGVPGDNMITVDLGFGEGEQDFTYLYD